MSPKVWCLVICLGWLSQGRLMADPSTVGTGTGAASESSSLYQLDIDLESQDGKSLKLATFAGAPPGTTLTPAKPVIAPENVQQRRLISRMLKFAKGQRGLKANARRRVICQRKNFRRQKTGFGQSRLLGEDQCVFADAGMRIRQRIVHQ